MKRNLIYILVLSLLLTGCATTPTSPTQTPVVTTEATTQATVPEASITTEITIAQEPMCAVSLPIFTEYESSEDGTVIFTHTYQNMKLILSEAEIADKVIVDFLNRTDTTQAAQQIKSTAQSDYAQGIMQVSPYNYSMTYEPIRLDNSVLSLLGTNVSYTGGMHPEIITTAITYDLLTGNSLRCSAIVLETVTADDLIPLIKDALGNQSATLYDGYELMVEEKFRQGLDHINDWYFSADGLCFFFSPYEIGPFSSGTITAQIPYGQLTDILRDIYFPAERDTSSGYYQLIAYNDANLDAYSQFAEVTTTPGGNKYLLFTDRSMQDIRIIQHMDDGTTTGYASTYTIFAAYGLTPGDAIILETIDSLQIQYRSGDQLITEVLPIA